MWSGILCHSSTVQAFPIVTKIPGLVFSTSPLKYVLGGKTRLSTFIDPQSDNLITYRLISLLITDIKDLHSLC